VVPSESAAGELAAVLGENWRHSIDATTRQVRGRPGAYAAAGCLQAGQSVVQANADGRRAAMGILSYLGSG
jgi:NADPH-dependent glutamate synthase beta subunit-like oxidoreductase